ncbi:MAG: triose-phosphate isomerase [Patescibacteria group bacterium]|nr:triose-phosphate isomerase [Patescibacteria group bacterium]
MKNKKKIVIANWKMNLSLKESLALTGQIKKKISRLNLVDKQAILCPDFLAITEISKILKKSKITLGAQDVFYEGKGAFTGQVSPKNLQTTGCQYVIVGHSEKRALGEDYQTINKKAKAVIAEKMIPIICVGETLAERKKGQSDKVVANQIKQATVSLGKKGKFLLAYEPIWSISTSGSGQVIDSQEAARMFAVIKKVLSSRFINYLLIYGGSVSPKTIADFSKIEDVSGVLVGGASLKADSFIQLLKNA